MIQAREHLFRRFEELGIVAPIVPYPAHQSVEEGKALRGQMAGTFTKNLLLKDKRGRLFLVAAEEDRPIENPAQALRRERPTKLRGSRTGAGCARDRAGRAHTVRSYQRH